MGNEITKDEMNEEHKYSHILCICGNKLSEIKIKSLLVAQCDQCYQKSTYGHIVYECCKNNKLHPDQYHICAKCIKTSIESPTTTPYIILQNMCLDYDNDLLLLALQDENGNVTEAMKWLQKNAITKKQTQITSTQHTQITSTQHSSNITEHPQITSTQHSVISSQSCCDINTCSSLINITSQLKNIYEFQIENDNHTKLLNDFHHLYLQHEFEDVYNYLISTSGLKKICPRDDCKIFKRNHRDRSQCSKQFYGDVESMQEINIQQIMDKIHCYFLHSFDTNRLTSNEQNTINDIYNDEKENIDHKLRELVGIVRAKKNVILSNKYKFNTTQTNKTMFSFGAQFIYSEWKGFKQLFTETMEFEGKMSTFIDETSNVKMMPAPYKFSSFKDEMLNNNICQLFQFQWNSQLALANYHLNSNFCKQQQPDQDTIETSCIETSQKEIGYENNVFIIKTSIMSQHLIAALLYCGFDKLSSKFSETYRKKNNETDQSLVQRHQNFAYFGRFLHEICYYFSDQRHGNYFYHGISENVYFDHTVSAFYSPFSTSCALSVAVNFASIKGMILTLKTELFMDLKGGFSCSWISDFVSEQEVLYFGYGTLRIVNIVNTLNNQSYEGCIVAINFIENLMKGLWYDPPDNNKYVERKYVLNTPQLAWRILHNQLNKYNADKFHKWENIPKYIESLFNVYCSQQQVVYIKWEELNKSKKCYSNKSSDVNHWRSYLLHSLDNTNIKGFKCLRSVLCLDDLTFIDLELFVTLFPNLKWIKIITACDIEHEYKFNASMIKAVLFFTQQSKLIYKLNQIQFILNQEGQIMLCDKIIKEYRKVFEKYGWSIGKDFTSTKCDDQKKTKNLMIKKNGALLLVNL